MRNATWRHLVEWVNGTVARKRRVEPGYRARSLHGGVLALLHVTCKKAYAHARRDSVRQRTIGSFAPECAMSRMPWIDIDRLALTRANQKITVPMPSQSPGPTPLSNYRNWRFRLAWLRMAANPSSSSGTPNTASRAGFTSSALLSGAAACRHRMQ